MKCRYCKTEGCLVLSSWAGDYSCEWCGEWQGALLGSTFEIVGYERGGEMSKVIGMYQEDRLVCLPCFEGEGESACAEDLPDGFTCDECGEGINA